MIHDAADRRKYGYLNKKTGKKDYAKESRQENDSEEDNS